MMIELQKKYNFSEVINFAFFEKAKHYTDSAFENIDIYKSELTDRKIKAETIIYLDEFRVVDEDEDIDTIEE